MTPQVAQKLRKLKHLRLLPVYDLVEKEIQGFHNSLPLMKELKSEALRCARRPMLAIMGQPIIRSVLSPPVRWANFVSWH